MLLGLSKYAKDFIDAADDSGNIRNNRTNLMYVAAIDAAVKQAGRDNFKAVYPFVGGTEFSCKFNFCDPRDDDGAFRLSFLGGGWIYDSNGVKPNGTSSYARSFLNANNHLEINNTTIGVFNNDNSSTPQPAADMGFTGSYPFDRGLNLSSRLSSSNNNIYTRHYKNPNTAINFSSSADIGLIVSTRSSSTDLRLYLGSKLLSSNTAINQYTDFSEFSLTDIQSEIFLFAESGTKSDSTESAIKNFSNRRQCFAIIAQGLSDSTAKIFSHNIQHAQRILGRAAL